VAVTAADWRGVVRLSCGHVIEGRLVELPTYDSEPTECPLCHRRATVWIRLKIDRSLDE
jgi:hypothetical protein